MCLSIWCLAVRVDGAGASLAVWRRLVPRGRPRRAALLGPSLHRPAPPGQSQQGQGPLHHGGAALAARRHPGLLQRPEKRSSIKQPY